MTEQNWWRRASCAN